MNVVAWGVGHGVAAHVNDATAVLIVGLRGRGQLSIDGTPQQIAPGTVVLVPRGAVRAIRAESRLVYLSCHPRRPRTFDAQELLAS